MISALIYVVSLAVLVQFFVYYCRSVLASSSKVELSARVREAAGVGGNSVAAEDFERFLELVRLCPENSADRGGIRAVGAYYTLLHVLARLTRAMVPSVAAWAERERQGCSHFAAVALDRRISFSRALFMQQASSRL
jgi:hypothetical protein